MNQSVTLSHGALSSRIKVTLKQSDNSKSTELNDAQKNSNPQDSSAPRVWREMSPMGSSCASYRPIHHSINWVLLTWLEYCTQILCLWVNWQLANPESVHLQFADRAIEGDDDSECCITCGRHRQYRLNHKCICSEWATLCISLMDTGVLEDHPFKRTMCSMFARSWTLGLNHVNRADSIHSMS